MFRQRFAQQVFRQTAANIIKDTRGYRFRNNAWTNYCTNLYLMSEKKAYNYCQANVRGIYPSSRAIHRRIEKSFPSTPQEQINVKFLADYLKTSKLPLTVSIAEDATSIIGRWEYCAKTNSIIGFSLPLQENGLPNYKTAEVRNARDKAKAFFTLERATKIRCPGD